MYTAFPIKEIPCRNEQKLSGSGQESPVTGLITNGLKRGIFFVGEPHYLFVYDKELLSDCLEKYG